jgi:xylose isomerase
MSIFLNIQEDMMKKKYSVILGNLGNTCDRFLSTGYKDEPDKDLMLRQAAGIEQVTGIELVGTWDIDSSNAREMKKKLGELKLNCASIIPDLFSQKCFGRGALAAADSGIRRKAVETVQEMTDLVVELGGDLINVWPGQDGYDYPLCSDYIQERYWMIDGLKECAEYATVRNVRLALEYKVKEPRTHSYLARVADTLLTVKDIDMPNVGVTIDTGHAFMAYENVAESIAILKMAGNKLFHMHFNDNYTSWDDDMIVGTIHLPEYFEMLYWLEKTGYDGWYSMDQYPYREDGCQAIRASVLYLQKLQSILDRVGSDDVDRVVSARNPIRISEFIRENLIA